MRVVTPFRPFQPESPAHKQLGVFDWLGAIAMLRESVRVSNPGVEVMTITDFDTELPGPTFQYRTEERRLMLWLLEVALCYVDSKDFDQDTVMISPDILVFGDLGRWFGDYDFGIVYREWNMKAPILNSVQFWPIVSKEKLIAFYEDIFEYARGLEERFIVWGADTKPFIDLLYPLQLGVSYRRSGLRVAMLDGREVLINASRPTQEMGRPQTMVDFRYRRKNFMREYFTRIFGAAP